MAMEYGVVLASLMGAAAALMGGVIAQRYQYMLERQAEHFAVLRDNVLAPWKRAIEARKSNLEGRDPYVVVDYVAKDYRSSPGVSFGTGDQVPWTEKSGLAEASKRHWPGLWSEWTRLNGELVGLGKKTIEQLRRFEAAFPPLPAGRTWANYPEQPDVARKMAVVNTWASHAQLFERRTYPDWVLTQITQFGFWRDDGDEAAKREYARKVVAALESSLGASSSLEAEGEALAKRFDAFARQVEDAIHTERFRGRCDYCPRFLR
ncbi:MAG: hypothetical protein ACYC2H_11525 [Thermoplasmatota archaeon]